MEKTVPYFCYCRMNSNQIVEIRFGGSKLKAYRKTLRYLSRIRR